MPEAVDSSLQGAAPSQERQGLSAALGAYVLWGFMPAYLRLLTSVEPLAVAAHRALWSCVFLGVVVLVRGWRELRNVGFQTLAISALSAVMLSTNWCLYVYAVAAHRVVDASLGYFINPLFNVLIGVAVLKERMRRAQWAAVGVAALGVLWLGIMAGQVPWVGLTLAVSFSLYGYFRKIARLGALHGLFLETLLMAPLALAFLLWAPHSSGSASSDGVLLTLLSLSGLVTAVPLLLFSYAARRIPLSVMGLVQYVSPSLQFVLGAFVWGEPFSKVKLVGYVLIWVAVLGYGAEGFWRSRAIAAELRTERA